MTTILFEHIGGGDTETPAPDGAGLASWRLRGIGYGVVSGGMGTGSLTLRQGGVGEGGEDIEPPSISIGEGSLTLLAGYSVGPFVAAAANGEGVLRIVGGFASGASGYGVEDGIGDAVMAITGSGIGPAPLGEDEPFPPPPDGGGPYYDAVALSDTVEASASLDALHTLVLQALMNLQANDRVRYEGTVSMTATMALDDELGTIFKELLSASVEFDASLGVDHIAMAQMFDLLLLSGTCSSTLEAKALLAETIAFQVLLDSIDMVSMADQVVFNDAVAQSYHAAALMVDEMLATATLAAAATFAVLLTDELALSIEQGVTLDLRALLRDRVDFVVNFTADNQQYVAWCMNTATKGLTRFTNYNFNSFLNIGGKLHGVQEDGLYLLGGPDDDGAAISAKVRLGLSALGTHKLKRTPEAYLYYSADGDLRLWVIQVSEVDGKREGHGYRLHARAAESQREGRVKIGAGLKAVYLDYELENIDGSDFELDAIDLHVIPLDARLRGNAGGQ